MDKREYQEKLQEINRLIASEDYEGAAGIADSIDWKRVRNVQTLVMISEVYEALERYEDSKVLLLRAYRRSPVGRMVLYRLVECCIKLRQFDQAIEYYSEYVQAAPHDNNKYILKYKIYRGRGSSLDEQIDILKEYLDQEYNEKWAYELARLEIQAGRVQEGLATCDDLVLWFHSGKYVIKALELKKKYAPLTPKQQEIYDNRFNEEEEELEIRPESYLSEAASLAKAERAAAAQEEIKSELAADISQTARIEATKVELSRKAEEAQAEIGRKAEEARKALSEKPAEDAAEEQQAEPGVPAEVSEAPAQEQVKAAVEEPAKGAVKEAAEAAAEAPVMGAAAEATVMEAVAEAPVMEAAAEAPVMEAAETPVQAVVSEVRAEEPQAEPEVPAEASEVPAQEPVKAVVEEPEQQPVKSAAEAPAQEPVKEAAEEPSQENKEEEPVLDELNKAAMAAAGLAAAGAAASFIGSAEAGQEDAGDDKAEADASESAAAADAAFREPAVDVTPEKMQEEMIRSMREIVSGVGPKDALAADEAVLDEAIEQSKEDQENAVAARGTDMTFRVPVSEASAKRQAGRLTIDDILLSMGDRGEHVRKVTGGSVMSANEEAQMTAQHQAEAKAASYDGMNVSRADDTKDEPEIPRFLREDVREARQTTEIPSEQIAQADDALRAQMGLESRDRASGIILEEEAAPADAVHEPKVEDHDIAESTPQVSGADIAAAAGFMSAAKVPYTKEIAEAKTRRLPVEEIRKLHEAYLNENAAAEEAAKNASQAAEKAAEMAEAEVTAAAGAVDEDVRIADAPGASFREETGEAVGQPAPAEAPDGRSGAAELGAAAIAAGAGAAAAQAGYEAAAPEMTPAPGTDGTDSPVNRRIGEQVMREVPKSAPEPEVFTGRAQLRENQRDLFRGFTSIGNLSEQIAGAIWQAENRKDDRTSRSGNILILGAHGCGKTTIATGIAKAIAEDMGTHSVKMARIYAADLNRKDIAATIAKIAGGVLIVEEAGDLDDAIVDQLTTAMEFRTDGLIMILEDEQRYIHELLMRHPRFTMKFTAQIYIPEYTSDDLVNFGRIYAESKDYVFSEKAVDACRDRIEAAKKTGEAVSVTNVIELVDRAIKSANTFFRRIGSSKKRYDEQDRVILREKDFR